METADWLLASWLLSNDPLIGATFKWKVESGKWKEVGEFLSEKNREKCRICIFKWLANRAKTPFRKNEYKK